MRLILFSPGLGLLPLATLLNSTSIGIDIHLVIDNKHAPYGPKSAAEVSALVQAAVSQAMPSKKDLLVVACNTSSHALSVYPLQGVACGIINLQEGTLRAIPETFLPSHSVLLLATTAIIEARMYERRIRETGAACTAIALPSLASHIDAANWSAAQDEIDALLPHSHEFSHIFLACSHYPLASAQFRSVCASRGLHNVPIVSQEGWLLGAIKSYFGQSFSPCATPRKLVGTLMTPSPLLAKRLSLALPNIQIESSSKP